MTGKQKFDVYQEVTDRIMAALETGAAPWHRPWSSAGGPVSLDGRPYRGINIFLLGLASYGDPRWGTYNAVKRHGGQVRKGERATRVILWKPVRGKEADEKGENGRDAYLLLRTYSVFNADQCDGLPELVREEREHTPIEAAEALVVGWGMRPPIHYGKSQAYYDPRDDSIGMPDAETFLSAEGFYSTQFHELTHATGHESRLKRIEPALHGLDPYAREELVAEMGAAMLCGLSGIDNLDQSAAYVEGWLSALANDKKLVIKAAAAAQKAVDLITNTTFEDKTNDDATAAEVAVVA